MATTQRSTVVGVFTSHDQADRAVAELRRAGFRNDQIGVAALDRSRGDTAAGETTTEEGSHAGTGAIAGVIAGAGVGGLVGLGIIAGVIPAIGPVIAGGTLAVILANAAGGAVIAGIAGALIGLGIPEEEAHHYESEFKAGRTIVTVKDVDGRYDEAWSILQRNGGYNRQHPLATASGTSFGRDTTENQTMQLREEELHARKQPTQAGEVRVRKDVVTENKTLEVPVQREEVVIERHPASGRAASSSDLRPGEEIRIPVTEEQVHAEKEAVVKEEVKVGKRKVQDTEHVGGTVRKEQVHVEREGDVDVRDTGKNPRK